MSPRYSWLYILIVNKYVDTCMHKGYEHSANGT